MKRLIITSLALVLALGLRAQDAKSLIAENPDRVGNNMHSYEFCEIQDTPAPKGFKPFYINHYGRHGSRYEQNSTFAVPSLEGFRVLDSLHLLNEAGKALYADVAAIQDAHVGMEGSLSPRGAQEHRKLAARMAKRFPSVFKNKDRQEVDCFASTSQRCIISMTNFSYGLKEQYPALDFNFTSADKFMKYINPSLRVYAPGNEPPQPAQPVMPATFPAVRRPAPVQKPPFASTPGYDFSRFVSGIVTDKNAALAVLGNPEPFVHGIYHAGRYCQLLDFMGIEILRKYFTVDELEYFWASNNDDIYRQWGNSKEKGDNVRWAARPLLQNFIDTADKALQDGSHRAADLRFGHDTAVLPLFALLGLDDTQARSLPYKEAHAYGWYAFFQVPMATNCQMIYYKNKKGEILTKILYNEKEVTLPGLKTDMAPYYRWEDLRAYFVKLIAWE